MFICRVRFADTVNLGLERGVAADGLHKEPIAFHDYSISDDGVPESTRAYTFWIRSFKIDRDKLFHRRTFAAESRVRSRSGGYDLLPTSPLSP